MSTPATSARRPRFSYTLLSTVALSPNGEWKLISGTLSADPSGVSIDDYPMIEAQYAVLHSIEAATKLQLERVDVRTDEGLADLIDTYRSNAQKIWARVMARSSALRPVKQVFVSTDVMACSNLGNPRLAADFVAGMSGASRVECSEAMGEQGVWAELREELLAWDEGVPGGDDEDGEDPDVVVPLSGSGVTLVQYWYGGRA